MSCISISFDDTQALETFTTYKMSTLADELLNDFEDSGSGEEDGQESGFLQDGASPPATNGEAHAPGGPMILDGDEEEVDEDGEVDCAPVNVAVVDVEDEEDAKAKVEKMQLGSVSDVRSVAGLMKTLEPVLQVCALSFPSLNPTSRPEFTSSLDIALTFPVTSRKSHTTRICHQHNGQHSPARSKTIPNTISLPNRIPSPHLLTTKSYLSTSSSVITTPPASLNSRLSSQIL